MKYVRLAVVFLTATGISIAFRQGMSGSSDAAQQEPSAERLDRAAGLDRPGLTDRPASRMQGPEEGASLALVPASTDSTDQKADLAFARLAAETGNKLLARAQQSPDNPHLLRQAAAHYRACLTHEPTAREAGELFAEIRAKLASIDRELARPARPAVAKPAPRILGIARTLPPPAITKPAPKPTAIIAAPTLPVAKPELIMVGPDGVPIRRADARD